jgi:putative oxidoreductase
MAFPSFRRPLPVTLRILLSLGFLAAALTKFLPHSGWQERFAAWGYPVWFVPVIGSLEIFGVLGLWVPRVSQQAMILLAIVLLEASYANLSHPPIMQAVRPILFLILLAALFVTQRMSSRRAGPTAYA